MDPCKPNASRWKIGSVGYPRVGARVGHAHFMLRMQFPVKYGLKGICDFMIGKISKGDIYLGKFKQLTL